MMNTAIGILAFLVPTIIAVIAKDNFGLVFIIAAVIFIVIGVVGLSIPELGESGKLAQSAKAREGNS
jgi:hypothetical protein